MVLHLHVPGQGRRVGQDVVVTHLTIMADMAEGHQIVMTADARSLVGFDALADVGIFAELIEVADGQGSGLVRVVAEVLGGRTQGGAMIDMVALAQAGTGIDARVALDDAVGANAGAGFDEGIRAYVDGGVNLRPGLDDGAGMDHQWRK